MITLKGVVKGFRRVASGFWGLLMDLLWLVVLFIVLVVALFFLSEQMGWEIPLLDSIFHIFEENLKGVN